LSNESTYDRGEAVCVIGAGASGLAAIKNLRERGFAVDCFERETGVGGSWNPRHDRSPVFAGAHLATSKLSAQYPDFPMPDHWPDYPRHSGMLEYLERYADHFWLREHIWFGSEVTQVSPIKEAGTGGSPRWEVTIRGQRGQAPRTTRYAAVVVATGYNWTPDLPEYPGRGDYQGEIIPGGAYRDPTQLRGRKVLVVGAGGSACAIAAEAARVATTCWHAPEESRWHVPEYLMGRPFDQMELKARAMRLPLWLRRWVFLRLIALTTGDLTRFGMPAPDHRLFDLPPVVDSQLGHHLGQGGIVPMPGIARFERDSVVMADGQVVEPDLIVVASDPVPRIDCLPAELLAAAPGGQPRLRWHSLAPNHPTLALVGLVRPQAGELACAHWQSVLFARWLRTLDTHPEQAGRFWASHAAADGQRYRAGRAAAARPRPWFEVDQLVYLRALERALNNLEAMA
jgi:thioredoxin reductase